MSIVATTYRRVLLIVAMVVAISTTATATDVIIQAQCNRPIEQSSSRTNSNIPEEHTHHFEQSTECLSMLNTSSVSLNLTPAVRTLRGISRHEVRTAAHSKIISAIDNTTTAQRYGLYNHKILFVSLPRIHYLCWMMRYII